jgi:hypothetical protein
MIDFDFTKPNRLVWQEKPSERLEGGSKDIVWTVELSKKMKKDLWRIDRPQNEQPEDPYTPEEFLREYHDVLTGDISAYGDCRPQFQSMGIDAFKKYAELGFVHLDAQDRHTPREYLSSILFVLNLDLSMAAEGFVHPLYKGKPDLAKKANKDTLDFMNFLIKDKASELLDKDPVALVETLISVAETAPVELIKFLEGKVKSFDLSDEDFKEVLRMLANTDEKERKVIPALLKIVLDSKEKPFGNLPLFVETVEHAAYWVKKTGDKEPLLLVLRRGKHFIEEDAQTKEKVAKKLADAGLKLEELKY